MSSMKRSVLIGAILLATGTTVFAQKAELNSAKSNFDAYEGLKSNPKLSNVSLDKAKASVDKAVVHEKTAADPEAWAYKALIYTGLAERDSANVQAQTATLTEAIAAVKKAVDLDTKGLQKATIQKANDGLYNLHIRKGYNEYKREKYVESYTSFVAAAPFIEVEADTLGNYYAAISAQNAAVRDKDEAGRKKYYGNAIDRYNNLLKSNFSYLGDVYSNLSVLYAANGDTAAAIRIAGEGAKRFPTNSVLATREIELSLMSGKGKETIDKIKAQFAKEPKNKVLPYYLGIAYNDLKDYKSAEEWYLKALEIDPNYGDAAINISGIIMNSGIDIYREANALPANKQAEYAAGMKKADAEFARALPYLIRATEIAPTKELAWKNLKAYYDIKNDKVKSNEIKKKIESL